MIYQIVKKFSKFSKFSLDIPDELKNELEALADSSDLKLGPYIRAVLENAVEDGVRYELKRTIRPSAEKRTGEARPLPSAQQGDERKKA